MQLGLLTGLVAITAVLLPFSFSGMHTASALGCVKNNITSAFGFNLGTCTIEDVDPACMDGSGPCSTADRAILIALSQCDQFKNCSDAQQADEAKAQKAVESAGNSCQHWTDWIGFTCFGRMASVLIGTALISVTAWLLAVAGLLFNVLVDHTIVNFSQFLYSTAIKSGIETAWAAFRDIANILIIGIFTFIAISIILGLKEFGQKRLIANVLIIAVLINFSLLFTKVIIDASNYTATQFYNAARLPSGEDASTGTTATEFSQSGISGQFINLMGVTSLADTYKALSSAAFGTATNNYSGANGLLALLHGLVSATVLLAAAAILLYGCFLLFARALLFIFLLVTASLAFASYLVPKWAGSSYGWSTWWSSLVRCAALAPILMLAIWVTLTIGHAIKPEATGTLGGLLAEPTKAANLDALFVYVIVLGLLFISFRIASVFSSKIAGFDWAAMPAGLAVALGSRFALAPLLRNTLGSLAFGIKGGLTGKEYQERLGRQEAAERGAKAARGAGNYALAAQAQREADRLKRAGARRATWAGRFGELADSKMNMMDTAAMKAAAKQAGLTGFAAGASAKGDLSYAGKVKAKAEAAEKATPQISDEQKKKIREEAGMTVSEERRGRKEALEATKQSTKEMREAIEQVIAVEKDQLKQEREAKDTDYQRAVETKRTMERDFEQRLSQLGTGAQTDQERQQIETDRALKLNEQSQHIEQARMALQQIDTKLKNVNKPQREANVRGKTVIMSGEEAETADNAARNELESHNRETVSISEERTREKLRGMEEARQNVAGEVGRQMAGPIAQFTETGERVAKAARSKIKTSAGTESIKKALEDYLKKETESSGGAAPEAPGTPAAPTSGH
ncbi:MAG: hypothetical protein RLZZ416_342 [Candidatus Parcubacteria bacterium]